MSFGPAGAADGAEQLRIAGARIGFAPLGVTDQSLEPTVTGATATYPGLWPHTSVTEQVTAAQVNESIELTGRSAPARFSFRLTGAVARPSPGGGLDVLAGGRPVGAIPPVQVTTAVPPLHRMGVASGTRADSTAISGARLSVSGDVVRVSVSRSWLDHLPASAFPVVIDPSFGGRDNPAAFVSVDSAGDVLSNQVMQVGVDSQGRTWRTAVYLPPVAVPSQITEPGNNEPWVLSGADFSASCPSGLCVQLENVSLYGMGTPPPPSFPGFAGITPQFGDLLAASPPGQLVGVVGNDSTEQGEATLLTYMHGRTNGWWFAITGNEGGANNVVVFDPSNTYATFFYVQQPPPTYVTGPTGVVATTTPTLTAAAAADTTNAPSYDFQISTSPHGTGAIVDSGWLDNQTSWTVPAGSLQEGATYYATVRVAISDQTDTTGPNYVPPAAPLQTTSFTVKERLGNGGPSPTDTIGSPPEGTGTPSQGAPSPGVATASGTVDMVTGDLAVDVTTPSMHALSGAAGVTLAYNSSSSSLSKGSDYGLIGQYFADGDGTHSFDSPMVGQRTDPGINQDWGDNGPVSGLNQAQPFMVRWKGVVNLPAGTWELGGLTTGGMRVFMNGSTTPLYNDWAGTASAASPAYSTTTVSGGAQYTIEVDDWDSNRTGNTAVQLWALNTATTPPTGYIVPSNWLTPVATGVPPGWSLLASPATVQWTHADDQGNEVVLSDGSGETVAFTRTSDGSYQTPPGDTDYLSVDGTGRLRLSTSSNELYTFNPDGSLASMTTIADDRHPAALQYTYTGNPALLSSITDPVSGRSITLSYGGSGSCPASVPAGNPAPTGMLCQISYWDGTVSTFGYNSSGQLASTNDPGNQTLQFGYDSDNRLADIRDALASDYVASGGQVGPTASCPSGTTGTSVTAVDTQICYDGTGRVASVTQPAPTPGAARPGRTYSYGTGSTSVSIAGFSPASGYAEKVTYDDQGRITSQSDSVGHTSTTVWANAMTPNSFCGVCGADEPIVSINPAGEQTSTVYDTDGNPADVYGPAPTACFSGGWPASVSPPPAGIPGYLPVSNPQGTSGCGVAVPHTHHGYDEGVTGLAETFWTNGQFAGAATQHGTGDGGPQPTSFCATAGTLCAQWAAGSPPVSSDASGHWSLKLTGTINLPLTGSYAFWLTASQPTTLSIDGSAVLSDTPAADSGFVAGQQNTVSINTDGDAGLNYGGGVHQIEIDFQGSAAQLNDFQISYFAQQTSPNQTVPQQVIPNTVLDPGYGLPTSATNPDGITTTTSYSNSSIGPEYGMPTATTVGTGSSAALTTTTTYEPPGPGSYLRKTSTTLPGGNTTSYGYYTGTGAPVAAACGVSASTPQGGQLESMTDPAPGSGAPAREQQFIYDTAGRQVGVRTGPSNAITSQPWQCTSYDALGRITSQAWPATSTAPARTVTHSYSVAGNPLQSSVSDGNGTITSTVDLLGRVTSYTDARNLTTTTRYDQAGRVQLTSNPADSTANSYDPNSGHLTSVVITSNLDSALNNTTLATASYDAAGRLSGVTYANGTTAAIGYDSYGHEDSLQFNNSQPYLAADDVTFDPAGQITTERQGFDGAAPSNPNPAGPGAQDYSYDGAGRLIGAWLPNGDQSTQATYSYAANPASDNCPAPGAGANTNRTRVTLQPATGSPTTTDYCYNSADQLTSTITNGGTPSTAFGYDARGNQTSDAGTTLTWDASDRATSMTTSKGSVTNLSYDAVNRVISRQTSGTTTGYWYSGYTDGAAGTLNSSGQLTQAFVQLPGGVTVTIQGSGDIWSYPDLHGNTTVTTDRTGNAQGFPAIYDPWGQLISFQPAGNVTSGSDLGAYGTDGKITDTASGIISMGARPYSPAQARFLAVDPVSGGCANPYTYAFGDPLTGQDLTGQDGCTPPGISCGLLFFSCTVTFSASATARMNSMVQGLSTLTPEEATIIIGTGCTLTAAVAGGAVDTPAAITFIGLCTAILTGITIFNFEQGKDILAEAAKEHGDFQISTSWFIVPSFQAQSPCKVTPGPQPNPQPFPGG